MPGRYLIYADIVLLVVSDGAVVDFCSEDGIDLVFGVIAQRIGELLARLEREKIDGYWPLNSLRKYFITSTIISNQQHLILI